MLIRARMRLTATWLDVCILNISSRGMQLQSARPPARGAYVEIRRGPHVVIGCVAWARQQRFGIRAQDVLFIDAIVAEPGDADSLRGPVSHATAERRTAPRQAKFADRSRMVGRAMEFACLGCLAALGATALYGVVQEALVSPLASVNNALGG